MIDQLICPDCAANVTLYPQPDIHTHWCESCNHGLIMKDNEWITLVQRVGGEL
jgi:hypothetical protein